MLVLAMLKVGDSWLLLMGHTTRGMMWRLLASRVSRDERITWLSDVNAECWTHSSGVCVDGKVTRPSWRCGSCWFLTGT